MTQPRFTLGTRSSPLALAQAHMVAAALETAHGWPAGSVAIHAVKTSGDRIQDRPLAEVGGKALWTKELDLALLAGETDASVHSMKDVESHRPETLMIAAMLPRADVRDRLIGVQSLADLPEAALVGTSSPRRKAQLLRHRRDLNIVLLRGNVDTRLAKCANGEVNATLLAAAGLDRLGRPDVGTPLPIEQFLPAPAQGAVGIECCSDDVMTTQLLRAIDDKITHDAVTAERSFTLALGGTCHSPVAALAEVDGDRLTLTVEVLSEDGGEHLSDEQSFNRDDLFGPAKMGRALLARAPISIRRLFEQE